MAEAEERALSELRQLILEGKLAAKTKISEVTVAELLGVSRTPAKLALARLEMTGLIKKLPGRGYIVPEINIKDVEKIIQARGALEGSAAGYIATHGASDDARRNLSHSLRITESIIKKNAVSVQDTQDYQAANTIFHETIMEQCGNEFIMMAYERLRHLPMAELGAVVPNTDRLEGEFLRMSIGHAQHTIIHRAIIGGDAMRAEMVMREHSNATLDYARLFVGSDVDAHIPSLKLRAVK